MDLNNYLARIGYTGEKEPTTAVLQQIVSQHTHHIAFENLSSLSGEVVPMDLPSIQQKLVQAQRGGYCFEHNTLLWSVLQQLGYQVSGLAARVRWNVPDEVVTPIGHMLLQVTAENTDYLVDAGFGGLTVTTPLRLDTATSQPTTHEAFRISRDGDVHTLCAQLGEDWKPLYSFDLHPFVLPDYEVWNWFTCTAPASPFINNLMCARPVSGGRHALINNRHTFRSMSGAVNTRWLTHADELRAVLTESFNIRLPESEALNSKLEEIAARPIG